MRPAIEQVALKTFHDAYIPAMRTTLIVPIVVLAVAVVGALFARHTERAPVHDDEAQQDATGAGPA